MSSSIEKRRFECAALPKGWRREEVLRKSGLTSGKMDVYYYSPDGKRFRSKPQLVRHLGETIDLSSFDFKTGKINHMLSRKNKRPKGTLFDYSRGLRSDVSLIPPIRQTASIFKQPVTVVKTQPNSKVKHDLKHGPQEKPKQLFWEKRLQGLQACDIEMEHFTNITLPNALAAIGPDVQDQTVLQSVATALHIFTGPVTGQLGSKSSLEKNPGIYINPEQPLVSALDIQDGDILSQEEKVDAIRLQLQHALTDVQT